MKNRKKIIRITTVPKTLYNFCRGQIGILSKEYDIIAISSPEEHLNKLGEEKNIRTIGIPMMRRIAPFKDLNSLFQLIKAFLKEKPDMVHSMTPKAGLLSMMAAWITRVPIRIHTFTGLVFPTSTGLKRKILIATDWITCACATHIIPEGEGVKRDLQQHGITQKELKVLGYGNIRGIDLKHYTHTAEIILQAKNIRKDLGIEENDFVFIFIGRLVGDKGINELVGSFEKLNINYPNIHLILVGQEEPQLDPLNEVTKEKIHRMLTIHAVGTQNDVRPWYAAADALVFPSYREGFPNVVIEAGAMNLPSIVTDINGSREIITEGVNGVIIPSKDKEALELAMKRFIQNPHYVKEMGGKARPIIADRYEQTFVWKCLQNFYKEILK